MEEVLAIIPARGGSKGIPNKNIIPLLGKPLIEYTISAALQSKYVTKVMVSTDSDQIAKVSREKGAEVPFLRSEELAQDSTPAYPVIENILLEYQKTGFYPKWVIYLQPTSPLRTTKHIDEALEIAFQHQSEVVVSAVEVPHQFNPVSVMNLKDGKLSNFLHPEEGLILRRQEKPKVYARNGPAILILESKSLLERKALYGNDVRPYLMEMKESWDIDEKDDLLMVEALLSNKK